VVQGDNLFKLDVKKVLEFHENKNAFMTIVLKPVENVEEFGVAELESDNRIKKFVEKPKKEEAPNNLANGYRARIRNHGHSCFLCEIVIRSQFHTTYEPEA
jgi:Nucleoside-diphosphate-sugar pyrophosphorylase involved in lipopolysaccharide biosynthesis/translation initiation factor 2B, gamma/epsilon subunits (eIF-2Bgamma/eIF-2Bepsilon)